MLAALTASALLLPTPAVLSEDVATGTISGRVTLTTRMRGVPISTNAYAPRAVTHQATPSAPEMRSVVLYLKDVRYKAPLPVSHAQIRQEDESFSPRVVAITRGSTVEFPNFDPYFHNVFSLSRVMTFDLGRFRKGEKRERTFARAGVIKVYCHIHSEMAATILVFDHHLYTTPGPDGSFAIDAVPAGTYQLSAWHERIGETTTPLKVVAGADASVEFALPVVEK